MAPRNRTAFERAQVLRAEILVLLKQNPATAPPLTAKRIQPLLSRKLKERAIQLHMRAIRAEHEPNTLRLPQFNTPPS